MVGFHVKKVNRQVQRGCRYSPGMLLWGLLRALPSHHNQPFSKAPSRLSCRHLLGLGMPLQGLLRALSSHQNKSLSKAPSRLSCRHLLGPGMPLWGLLRALSSHHNQPLSKAPSRLSCRLLLGAELLIPLFNYVVWFVFWKLPKMLFSLSLSLLSKYSSLIPKCSVFKLPWGTFMALRNPSDTFHPN